MTDVPRTFLFTPGSRPDRFEKAAATSVDALILDLEDAVAQSDKALARANVTRFVASRPAEGPRIVVRINPLDCVNGLEDLAAMAQLPLGPYCLLVPKVENPSQISAVANVLENTGSQTGVAALIESANGIVNAAEVARAQGLMFLMFGAADYAADLGQQVGTSNFASARSWLVNAAAAGGTVAIDSPSFKLDKTDELERDCLEARAQGFHGKAAIHPSQIGMIRESFAPSEAEIAHANRILAAAPRGVGVLDGKMIDVAMLRWAERTAGVASEQ